MKEVRLQILLTIALLLLIVVGLATCQPFSSSLPTPTPAPLPTQATAPKATPQATASRAPAAGSHSLFIEPDDGGAPILNAIKAAATTLDVKIYLLTYRDVIDALKDAPRRGVKVRVMLEKNVYGGGSSNQDAYDALKAANVDVRWSNPVFSLTHEKSMVVDGKTAYIMTANLVYSAFTSNREYGIITSNPAEVQEIQTCFNADWERTGFTPPAKSTLAWSNVNMRRKLLEFIDGAQTTLILEQESMQDKELIQHLVSAAQRGTKVRFILAAPEDSTQSDPDRPGALQLQKAGVDVRVIKSPKMHAKLYLADGRRIFVGSANPTTSSLNNNRELNIALDDPLIVKRIADTFEKDWAKAEKLQ